jgi:hypothetical protein
MRQRRSTWNYESAGPGTIEDKQIDEGPMIQKIELRIAEAAKTDGL